MSASRTLPRPSARPRRDHALKLLAKAVAGRDFTYNHGDHCLTLKIDGVIDSTRGSALYVEAALARYPKADRIELQIDSHGGSVREAQRIHDLIRAHSAGQKSATIFGMCASAAVSVLLAADFRAADRRAVIMIHEPSIDRANDERWTARMYRQRASLLDRVTRDVVSLYEKRTGRPRAAFEKEIADENTMSPAKALRLGLIECFSDEVIWLRGQPFIFPQMGRRP